MNNFPIELLREWFLENRRLLPWRKLPPTPYQVWISEIMLQQTQVAVVIPYFERWMNLFPTIESLAQAPLEKVIKCWEGLGYYSRARNLLKGANYIVEHHRGEFPSRKEEIAKIPGIGPYTLGAICSFAFHQKEAAVDGNVLRVLSRFKGFSEPIDTTEGKRTLNRYADEILPDEEPWIVAEALIELGALVCMKRPNCGKCPLKKGCFAYQNQLQHILPNKRKGQTITPLFRHVAVIQSQGKFLIQKRESGQVMADLYEYPYLEMDPYIDPKAEFEEKLGLSLNHIQSLAIQKQAFTRYRVELFPHLYTTDYPLPPYIWKSEEELEHLPFSSGHRKILRTILHGDFR
jgi:A/G-specific adenine glycosylase